jgi:hypothetical protein
MPAVLIRIAMYAAIKAVEVYGLKKMKEVLEKKI